MKAIVDFWKQSYHQDKLCFWLEMVGAVLTIAASLTLAVSAAEPDMRLIYPLFFAGSILAVFTYYRRMLVWPLVLMTWFTFVNVFGWFVAMGIV